jgi:hypothetical protein
MSIPRRPRRRARPSKSRSPRARGWSTASTASSKSTRESLTERRLGNNRDSSAARNTCNMSPSTAPRYVARTCRRRVACTNSARQQSTGHGTWLAISRYSRPSRCNLAAPKWCAIRLGGEVVMRWCVEEAGRRGVGNRRDGAVRGQSVRL